MTKKKLNSYKLIISTSLSLLIILGIYLEILPSFIFQKTPLNFYEAKKIARIIFTKHPKTFYCNCDFSHAQVDFKSCGYKPYQDIQRASRIEFEHIMPAFTFGKHLSCWKNKICKDSNKKKYRGRKCCQTQNKLFNKMEADLHNLVPAVGEINKDRSHYSFGLLPHIKTGRYGNCLIKIDHQRKLVEPAPSIRGVIARAYLYMQDAYHIHLNPQEMQLFNDWNRFYPPDNWEKEWDNLIYSYQGNHNKYIYNYGNFLH